LSQGTLLIHQNESHYLGDSLMLHYIVEHMVCIDHLAFDSFEVKRGAHGVINSMVFIDEPGIECGSNYSTKLTVWDV